MAGVPAVEFAEVAILQGMAANFHRRYGIFMRSPPIFHSATFSLRPKVGTPHQSAN